MGSASSSWTMEALLATASINGFNAKPGSDKNTHLRNYKACHMIFFSITKLHTRTASRLLGVIGYRTNSIFELYRAKNCFQQTYGIYTDTFLKFAMVIIFEIKCMLTDQMYRKPTNYFSGKGYLDHCGLVIINEIIDFYQCWFSLLLAVLQYQPIHDPMLTYSKLDS